jgi:tetratricopeptide (TPR) repeat protein
MSSPALACPCCQAALRSHRRLPQNKKVRCPRCRTSFTTPSIVSESVVTIPTVMEPLPVDSTGPSKLMIPALFAGMFLLGGLTVAGVYLAQPSPPASPRADEAERTNAADRKPKGEDARSTEERRQLDEERRQLENEKKRLTFERLMRKAGELLSKKNYAEAENIYADALKLFPDDADAKNALSAAQAARQAVESAAAHAQEEKKTRAAEIARLCEQGKAAMDKKEFAAAVRAYTQAKQLAPDNERVIQALDDARAAADADAAEKQKLADYQKHLDAGRAAMTAQNFEEAVAEFQAALKLLPGDATAAIDLKTAQNRLDAGVAGAKKQQEFDDLMQRVQAAFESKRPDRAIPILKQALKLFPDDKDARRLLKKAKADAATAQTEYNRLMALGDAAMTRQRFDEAKRFYAQAGDVLPDDAQATAKLQAATNALTNFAPQRTQYNALMLRAAAAAQQLQYAESIALYTQALQLIPNDLIATQALIQAKYGQALAQGRIALAATRLREAIVLFETALTIVPNDPVATALLAQARLRMR